MAGDSVLRTRFLPALLVSLIALIAASLALLPGVQFWDTGELQAVGPLMGTTHPTGFPTYVLLGWLASVVLQPFGEPAFRMNLFSALCVAVAAGVTVDLVRALTGHLVLGIAAGIGLALTPIAWAIATHAEAHSLHLALVAILLWLLVAWDARVRAPADAIGPTTAGATILIEGAPSADGDPPNPIAAAANPDRGDRYLVAAAFVFALAVGNHSLTLLLAVPVGLYVLAVDPGILRRGRLVLTCLAVLVGTVVLVYLELPLRAGPFRSALVYGTPNTLDGFRYIVLAEQFRGSLSNPFGDLSGKVGDLVSLAWSQFGVLALLIPFGFVATVMRHPRYALLTGSAALITVFFAASYVNADIDRYYLGPALMAWTWLAILAAATIELIETTVSGPAPAEPDPDGTSLTTRGAAPIAGVVAVVLAVLLLVPTAAAAGARFKAVDESRQHVAADWVSHVFDVAEPDAAILSWWSYSTPLWYAQRVQGERPDIAIIDDRTRLDENLGGLTETIDANLGKRPVYVIRADPREVKLLADRYELDYIDGTDASKLTKVIGLKGAAGS